MVWATGVHHRWLFFFRFVRRRFRLNRRVVRGSLGVLVQHVKHFLGFFRLIQKSDGNYVVGLSVGLLDVVRRERTKINWFVRNILNSDTVCCLSQRHLRIHDDDVVRTRTTRTVEQDHRAFRRHCADEDDVCVHEDCDADDEDNGVVDEDGSRQT